MGCLWHRLQVKASWGKILTLKLLPMALPLVCQGVCICVCVCVCAWDTLVRMHCIAPDEQVDT